MKKMPTPPSQTRRFNALKSRQPYRAAQRIHQSKSNKHAAKYQDPAPWVSPNKKTNINSFYSIEEDFPTLGDSKNVPQQNTEKPQTTYKNKIQGLFEKRREKKRTIVAPGIIQWSYNDTTKVWTRKEGCMQKVDEIKETVEYYRVLNHITNMIERWQKFRDEQNELLLDSSPFCNERSLLEFSDDS